MDIKKVRSVYFTGTGTTKEIVSAISLEIAELMNADLGISDFSLPSARTKPLIFAKDELAVFGTFVVAGRVPNVLLPFLNTLQGNGGSAVPIVLYGNRNYDDALVELNDILTARKLHAVAAAAFIGEHSFSNILAANRPDAQDLNIAKEFAKKIVQKLYSSPQETHPLQIPGIPFPYRNYYQPLNISGEPVRFLKAKPETNAFCIDCKLCADICPMGSIDRLNVQSIPGICIKCCACIKKCPAQAKHFFDEDFLSHKASLEETYTTRKEPELFL